MARFLVTGCAGFIGFHVSQRLLARGDTVIGVDSVNDYYDVNLKEARLAQISAHPEFSFSRVNLANKEEMERIFAEAQPDVVINLAAQAGVRYSLTNPHAYIESNLIGFLHILEGCRHQNVKHLVFASSSSVYGLNQKMPFATTDNVDHPVSLYAATKKANELMAHSYSHLYGFPSTGLRFFTVYGPWGRPDMALFLFTKAILAGEPIKVFNNGEMQRDFTYVDDIVEGILRVSDHPAQPNPNWDGNDPDPGTSKAPYRIYNIGNSSPVPLMRMIEVLEDAIGKKAIKEMHPIQPGDVPATFADVAGLSDDLDFRPSIPIEAGVPKFVAWYREFYGV